MDANLSIKPHASAPITRWIKTAVRTLRRALGRGLSVRVIPLHDPSKLPPPATGERRMVVNGKLLILPLARDA